MEHLIPTRVGLIGWPVAHSRSPAMHQAAFQALGLSWDYLLLPVQPEFVEDAVRGLRALGFAGANVTVPHKEAVLEALDEVTPEAQAIGAVNTIVNRNGRLVGYNTDVVGFMRGLKEGGFTPQGCRALVLGAGGASRAVLYALLAQGATVTLANRSVARAQGLAQHIGPLFQAQVEVIALDATTALDQALAQSDLLVNTTSVGMSPHHKAIPLPARVTISPGLVVYDLVYNPLETQLLQATRASGGHPIDGLGMLVHQGAAAFELWTGETAPVEQMRSAALQGFALG